MTAELVPLAMMAARQARDELARRGLVVIGCGAGKLDRPAPAAELYTGQHFRACLLTARALVPDERIRILSARYGLVGLADELAPYDLTIGQPGAIGRDLVMAQANARGLLDSHVIALCAARYVELLRWVWPGLAAPLAGQGIGQQRHTLALIRSAARLVRG